jgi:hypothetical protein
MSENIWFVIYKKITWVDIMNIVIFILVLGLFIYKITSLIVYFIKKRKHLGNYISVRTGIFWYL